MDKSLPGPDHVASLNPQELKAMVAAIRNIEEAMGHSEKLVSPSECKNIAIARKSIVASRCIKRGGTPYRREPVCKTSREWHLTYALG